MTDYEEINEYNTDPLNPDTNDNGLMDGREFIYNTDPLNPDTDGDDISDGDEVENKTNPLDKYNIESKLLITLYFGVPFLSIMGVSVVLIKRFK